MKKLILFALLVVATGSAFAQTTPPAPAAAPIKKEFKPDYTKPVTLQVTIPLGILSQYAYTLEHPDFDNSDLPTKNANAIKKGNAALADSIYMGFTRILQAQNIAWAADTLKQFNLKNSKTKKP